MEMSRISIPPDLVRLIAEYLYDDSHTLVSLCLLDKESLGVVVSLLYKTVHLSSIESICQFCDAVLHSTRNLGAYPTLIHFNPEIPSDIRFCRMLNSIRDTLRQTPNLKDLVLNIDVPNLVNLYQDLQLHPPPFSLHCLICYFTPDHLLPFLSTQQSIHTLTLHESSLPYHTCYIRTPPPPHVLPHLKSITAHALTVHALLPGRPITHVNAGRVIFSSTARIFCESLRESTAQGGVRSVSICVPQTKFWTSASDSITRLAGVCGESLEELCVRMSNLLVRAEVVNLGGYTVLVEVLVASLSGFSRLRHFQFEGMDDLPRHSGAIEELGDVGTLAFWTGQCTSLRRVTLFGVDLP